MNMNDLANVFDAQSRVSEAMFMIRDTCINSEDCVLCPFFVDNADNCMFELNVLPCDWEVNQPNADVWRAFKPVKPERYFE